MFAVSAEVAQLWCIRKTAMIWLSKRYRTTGVQELIAKQRSRKTLVSREDVIIPGSLKISGHILVGGNLTIDGDLECSGPVLVLGHLDVTGSVRAATVVVGQGVKTGEDLRADTIIAHSFEDSRGFLEIAEEIIGWLPKSPRAADLEDLEPHEFLADEDTLASLEISPFYGNALEVGRDCISLNVEVTGSIEVGRLFNPDNVDALGYYIDTQLFVAEGDVTCGSLTATHSVSIEGCLHCSEVETSRLEVGSFAHVEHSLVVTGPDRLRDANGYLTNYLDPHYFDDHLEAKSPTLDELAFSVECGEIHAGSIVTAGSIMVDGEIVCSQSIRANRSITAGKSIAVGRGYAIYAGLGIPSGEQFTKGFVCAPERPPRIASGEFRFLGRRIFGRGLRPIGWGGRTMKRKG